MKEGLALALAALRNNLVEREDIELVLAEDPNADVMAVLVERELVSESERAALRVLEEARGSRNAIDIEVPARTPSTEDATVEMVPLPVKTARVACSGVPAAQNASERYTTLDELGRGGIGAVFNTFDHNLQRHVAMKIMLPGGEGSNRFDRFIREARLSAQLQHPNIVPVYDMGEFSDDRPFFSMRLVRGRPLADLLDEIRKAGPAGSGEYTQLRLLSIFQDICMGMAYAHDKGIIHRDLKPENVMIGDFGEVLVMDWGLAKFRDQEDIRDRIDAPNVTDPQLTSDGTILGTPIFMSPEQAAGRVGDIDERSDVYSLGAILYEILTLKPPFEGSDIKELLRRIIEEEPVAPSARAAREKTVHPELDRICLKALKKPKKERYASARALYDDIQRFKEGAKETARRREEAREAIEEGKKLAERYFAMAEVVARYERTRDAISRKFRGWEPVQEKKELWAIEDQVERMQVLKGRRFADAVNKFVSALEHESDNKEARENLARLHWTRFIEAEEKGWTGALDYYMATVSFFNDGFLDEEIKGDGTISIDSEPRASSVMLSRFVMRDRMLVPESWTEIGPEPIEAKTLPMGSYLLEIRAEGGARARMPMVVTRRAKISVRPKLFTPEQVGAGFVHVPAGPFVCGGDPAAVSARPRSVIDLPDFFIARFPVTCAEYIEFLNTQPPEKAALLAPVEPATGNPLWASGADGVFTLPDRASNKAPFDWAPDMPVVAVSWHMAKAYCEWRSMIDGRNYSLPTEEQWEKAARGVDGRQFPWGSKFDPTFCKNNRSRPGTALPERVGAFPSDESPYGVRDMAGGVREWCETCMDPAMDVRLIRGGSWAHAGPFCRCASRSGDPSYITSYLYGFRLATAEVMPRAQEKAD